MEESLALRIREMKLFPALFCSVLIHALALGGSKMPSAAYSGRGAQGAVDARLVATPAHSSAATPTKARQSRHARHEDIVAYAMTEQDGAHQPPNNVSEPSTSVGKEPQGSPDAEGQYSEDLYFATDYLTRRPEALSEIELAEMPSEPLERGSVVLALRISLAGDVVSASVVRSSFSEDTTLVFRSAFEKLRFRPGEIHGKAVGVLMWVEAGYADVAVDDASN